MLLRIQQLGGPSVADGDRARVVPRRVRPLQLVVDVFSLDESIVGSESRRMKAEVQQVRHGHGVGQSAGVIQKEYLQNTDEVLHSANLCGRPPINIPDRRK